ncbi:hypothetical protein Tco_1384756 [Tanacetum coccineum]
MLKTHLQSKDVSIEFLKSENQKVLTDKNKLDDKYLDEIKTKNASQDLHKDILGRSNPRYGKKAPVINASNVWDTNETLASAEVSMAKMKGKRGHVRPESGFYEKLNAMMFVPQKTLSRDQVYWLPANEIASQASTPSTPVTPYVPKSPPPSQVIATLHNIKAVFPQFDAIIKERTTIKPLYVSLPCYEYAKEFALQQVVPFFDYFKKHVQTADDIIVKEGNTIKFLKLEAGDSKLKRLIKNLKKRSFDKQALETDLTQLKDVLTLVRIQIDGYKAENDLMHLTWGDATERLSCVENRRVVLKPLRNPKYLLQGCIPTVQTWRLTGKVVVSVKPQWKPTRRHFALYDNCPLTMIMEPIVEPLELTPSVSSSSKVTMISRNLVREQQAYENLGTSVFGGLKGDFWRSDENWSSLGVKEGSLLNLSDHRCSIRTVW